MEQFIGVLVLADVVVALVMASYAIVQLYNLVGWYTGWYTGWAEDLDVDRVYNKLIFLFFLSCFLGVIVKFTTWAIHP